MMFSLFRKKQTPVTADISNTTEMVSVEVPDIKQYLVDEFARTDNYKKEIAHLKKRINGYEQIRYKYDAQLVVLAEYKLRITKHDEEVTLLEDEIEKIKIKYTEANNTINDLKIQLSVIKSREEDLYKKFANEILQHFQNQVIELITDTKGVIKKDSLRTYIESLETPFYPEGKVNE